MSLVSDGISALLSLTAEAAGEAVTYARGATSIAITGAVQGDTNWDADNPQPGIKIGERSVDWIIESAQVVDSSGTQLTPEAGDTITTADGRVFRCLPFGPQNQIYRWLDRNGRSRFRIHTKER